MAKRDRKEKDNWKKNVGRSIWKRKNSVTIFSVRDKQQSLNIFRDSNDISKTILFIVIWF
nr:hypothetical protein [Clostridium sp. AM45-5]